MNKQKPIYTINTKPFNRPSGARFWFWKVALKICLLLGNPVVLVGACRMGKSLLLNRVTPGKVLDNNRYASAGSITILESELPSGISFIDDAEVIEMNSLNNLMGVLAEKKRAFGLSTQRYSSIERALATYTQNKNAKWVLLVVVGGKFNRSLILKDVSSID